MGRMTDLLTILPPVRGRYTADAPLGEVGWFRAGGRAEVLFKPEDRQDLADFLRQCPTEVPVTALGVLSNTIVRDGGLKGVAIRLGREFAGIERQDGHRILAGAAALDGNVAAFSAREGIAGLEYLSGVPGTIGGAIRMNAGAYETETKDVLVEAYAIDRKGVMHTLMPEDMDMSYRHNSAPDDMIFTDGLFQGRPGNPEEIEAHIRGIKEKRSSTQPIKSRTGGSTFANPSPEQLEKAGQPPGTKTWQLIDRAGCRGLRIGDAQMSEMHCNFMLNLGSASATDLENLGEDVRRRVYENSGVELRWEIKRIGNR